MLKRVLLALFLLCWINPVAMASQRLANKVELEATAITIQEVVDYLTQETDYSFFFKSDDIDTNQVVSVNVHSDSIEEVLSQALAKTNLAYSVKDKNIVIYEKASVKAVAQVTQQQGKSVKGNIVDLSGEPVIGATVMIKGTTVGSISDIDGNFTLNINPGDILEVRYIGYKPQTVKYKDQKDLQVVLREDSELLDEVVVVGFGTQKKINVTGSVGTVSSKELDSRPVNNVSQALQGVVPGLNLSVNSDGGMINNKMNINIRGTGTIGQGSSASPLVLIDGVEGDMNVLAPQDIESISVLKDASSAAIYGARAAFGVILITTKSGKTDRVSVNYSNSFRFSKPITLPKMMNSRQFAQYYNRAAENQGQGAVFSDETMALIEKTMNNSWTDEEIRLGLPSGTRPTNDDKGWRFYGEGHANTDWFKEQYKSVAPAQEHNLSVSGGSQKITYAISGSFLDVTGLVRHGGDNLQRFNLNAKFNIKFNDYVKLSYSSKWTRQEYDRPSYLTGLFFHNIARRWPTVAPVDPNGHYTEPSEIIQMRDGGRDKEEQDWLTNYLQLIVEPIKDWKIYVEGSHRTEMTNGHWDVLPIYQYNPSNEPVAIQNGDNAAGSSRVNESSNKVNFYSFNGYTDYSKTIGKHYFKALTGFNAELMKTRGVWGTADNLISPSIPTLNTSSENMKTGGGYAHWSTAGFFGRLNYNYDERYIIEMNGRYDGVSRFIGSNRWGFFPSFSVGWNLGNENFYKDNLGVFAETLHTFKLRGSWGDLGNMNTNNWYPFYQTMPYGRETSNWLLNGTKQNTSGMPGIVSSQMTWERVRQWNIGLDFGAFNNRLTGSFDYFTRTTLDMIGPAPEMPSILGTGVPQINNCDMKSYGWELEIGWRDQIKDFSYGAKLVLSDAQQKITRYPNESKSLSAYYSGRKMGDIWGYQTKGIAQTQQEMNDHLINNKPTWGSNWGAGDIMYVDRTGDGQVNNGKNTLGDHGDLKILGNNTPRYKYGIFLDAAYKGFDFSMFFQGVGKRDYNLGGAYFWGASGQGMWQAAGFKEHWDFWRPEGDPLGGNTNAYYPKVIFSDNRNTQTQSKYIQNAAYIRLKNIQLGYTLPKQLTQKARINKVRIYISGDNMWTKSSISGVFDPETLGGDWGAGKLYPLQKTMSFGMNVNF